MKKLIFLIGLGIGFVLGSKVGREPYEKLEATARGYVEDPRVQEKVGQARDTATRVAKDAADTVKEKAPEVASAAKETAQSFTHRKDGAEFEGSNLDATDRSTDSSVAGGDAQVGEGKLES